MDYPKALARRPGLWRINESLLSELVFLAVVFLWGISFVFSKDALQVVGPFTYNTLRMLLGAGTLALLAGRKWRELSWAYLWPALLTGAVLFVSYGSQAYGMQFTTASKAGFLTGTNLVYVPIFSAVLLRRAPTPTAIGGVLLAFIGLFLLSVEGSFGLLRMAPGDMWVASSGIGWALYFILLARYSPRFNVMIFSALHVFVAGLLSGICWIFLEPPAVPWQSGALWVGLISTGFLIIGLGTSVQTWAARWASPTRIALIAALEPVFAALAGWWVGEPITPRMLVGGLLILAGMLLAESVHFRAKRSDLAGRLT